MCVVIVARSAGHIKLLQLVDDGCRADEITEGLVEAEVRACGLLLAPPTLVLPLSRAPAPYRVLTTPVAGACAGCEQVRRVRRCVQRSGRGVRRRDRRELQLCSAAGVGTSCVSLCCCGATLLP